MKKFLAVLMAAAMVLSLAACGSSDSDDTEDTTEEETTEETEATEEEETEDAEEETEEEETEEEETEEEDTEEEETEEEDSDSATSELDEGEVYADLDYEGCDLSGLTIGYVTINSSAPWGGLVGTNFEAYAEACGATVNVLDANTDSDVVTQYCEQFIAEGVDALVVFGGDPSAMSEVAIEASDAGIPMFLCALDADEETEGYDDVTAMIGPDQYDICADIAAYIVDTLGTDEEYNVFEINGVPFLQDYIDRTAGFEDYMADYSNFTLVDIQDAYSDRTEAKSFTENWITAYGDDVDIIMGYDDDLTMGAVQAIEEAGMTGEVLVYSMTGQADAIQAIIDGQMECTVMNRTDSIAAGTVTAIAEYFETGSTDRIQRCEYYFITADNAEEYLDQAEF